MPDGLHLVIRTPHEVVFDAPVRAARVPTQTGQVGLRPRGEPLLLAIEPGLILLFRKDRDSFAATAGGLLDADRELAVLYTPFAVQGDDAEQVLGALDASLSTPGSEAAARRRLGELEERIVQELRHRPQVARTGRDHG